MNNLFMVSITVVALVVSFIGVTGGLLLFFWIKKHHHRIDAVFRVLQDDVSSMCSGAVGLGSRIDAVSRHVRSLSDRQDQYDLREPTKRAYQNAVRLANKGANIEDLMSSCGITQGEAELISIMHQQQTNHSQHNKQLDKNFLNSDFSEQPLSKSLYDSGLSALS